MLSLSKAWKIKGIRSAFSLVEMSIVLVIIGLLVAGVTVGQGMILQSKLRAIAAELTSFKTAVDTFKGQYANYPGDWSSASSLWTTVQVGNGNGVIEKGTPNTTTRDEGLLAWQQLSLADLLPGNYTGTASIANAYIPITNIPASKYGANSGYYFDNTTCYPTKYYITLGGYVANAAPTTALLSAASMASIDNKIDDGLPGTGSVLSYWFDSTGYSQCTNTPACALNASNSYNLSITTASCILSYVYR
jgi:prepilin-type N-terminal cleavage/methylation domain-containing protein